MKKENKKRKKKYQHNVHNTLLPFAFLRLLLLLDECPVLPAR